MSLSRATDSRLLGSQRSAVSVRFLLGLSQTLCSCTLVVQWNKTRSIIHHSTQSTCKHGINAVLIEGKQSLKILLICRLSGLMLDPMFSADLPQELNIAAYVSISVECPHS